MIAMVIRKRKKRFLIIEVNLSYDLWGWKTRNGGDASQAVTRRNGRKGVFTRMKAMK